VIRCSLLYLPCVSDELIDEVRRAAESAVEATRERVGDRLDYSEKSLDAVEEMLAEAAPFVAELPPEKLDALVEQLGSYVLEVGRREFGGRYLWHPGREAPVLVVGEPDFRVALLTWDKVRGRLSGDEADNIPFLYGGFASAARKAGKGVDVLFV
jgi:hypothetical protein